MRFASKISFHIVRGGRVSSPKLIYRRHWVSCCWGASHYSPYPPPGKVRRHSPYSSHFLSLSRCPQINSQLTTCCLPLEIASLNDCVIVLNLKTRARSCALIPNPPFGLILVLEHVEYIHQIYFSHLERCIFSPVHFFW